MESNTKPLGIGNQRFVCQLVLFLTLSPIFLPFSSFSLHAILFFMSFLVELLLTFLLFSLIFLSNSLSCSVIFALSLSLSLSLYQFIYFSSYINIYINSFFLPYDIIFSLIYKNENNFFIFQFYLRVEWPRSSISRRVKKLSWDEEASVEPIYDRYCLIEASVDPRHTGNVK